MVVLDGFSDNMELTANTGKYGDISTTDSTTISYHVVKFLSNKVTLNGYNNIYRHVFKSRETSVRS